MKKTQKLLILFYSDFPYSGGGRETGLYNISREGKEIFDINVITLNAAKNRPVHFPDAWDFLTIHPVFSWQGLMHLRGYNRFARGWDARGGFDRIIKKARGLAPELRPDVVMSFDTSPLGLAAMEIAHDIGAVSAVNMRAFFAEEVEKTNPYLQHRVEEFRRIEKQVIQGVDLMLCNGEDTLKYCTSKYHRDKLSVAVHNGVNVELFKPNPSRLYRKKLGGKDNEVVFISNNPVRDIKGPQDAIRALAKLPELIKKQIRLIFLGKGAFAPFAALAESLGLKEQVHYLGFVSHDELPKYLSSADVAIHPVLFSAGTTHASLETLACGLPQVSYDGASLATTCVDRETGLLVPLGDIDALSNAMREMVEKPENRRKMGHNAIQHAQYFSWPNYVKRYADAINQVIKDNK